LLLPLNPPDFDDDPLEPNFDPPERLPPEDDDEPPLERPPDLPPPESLVNSTLSDFPSNSALRDASRIRFANSGFVSKNENASLISIRPISLEFKPVSSQITRNNPPGFSPSLRPRFTK